MKLIRKSILFFLIIFFFIPVCQSSITHDQLKKGFETPPDSTRPATYWYFMSGHISKEGITKDLEAMKKFGIGEVFIADIFVKQPSNPKAYIKIDSIPQGNALSLSKEWWNCMKHAVEEGTRLGMGISFFNCPGWSQSGGPWVKKEDAMRYLVYSDTLVSSFGTVCIALKKPTDFFQDVAVLAYPADQASTEKKVMNVSCNVSNADFLTDGKKETICKFYNKNKEKIIIDISYVKPFTARSLTISPTEMRFKTNIEVQIPEKGKYVTVKEHFFDHAHNSLQRGPIPSGDMILALNDIVSEKFRIILKGIPDNFELTGIDLSSSNKLENATEKWLNKMLNQSKPGWEEFQWKTQTESSSIGNIPKDKVVDLSKHLKGDLLVWENAPKGNWKIIRIGMTTTGTVNTPASPSAVGLETDKMNRNALRKHFDSYAGKLINNMSPEEKKSLKRIIADSYETGPQNWTDDMRESFIKTNGYDPVPWLPVLTGTIVGTAEESDRFLWDMRRLIADKIADEYVGGLRDICEENGVKMWLENYGHWGFPSEFLKYGGRAHEIGGEFWTNRPSVECRLAASASHIYGKNRVYAESYTSSEVPFSCHPGKLKTIGDWSYTQGINQGVLHLYIHQPYEDKVPGINAWFGTEINRHNTWFEQAKSWVDYLRRCYFMLQQGNHVADVCFFIGEDAPKMDGWVDEHLSKSYDYDFVNAEVIEKYMTVKNSRLVLPGGASYATLILPPLETMRPALLKKIRSLLEQGGIVVGAPPVKSPSLSGYPACDDEVKAIATSIWGKNMVDKNEQIRRKVGNGMVYYNVPLDQVLEENNTKGDLILSKDSILWIHRKMEDKDIYFLTNQGKNNVKFNASFRINNESPEWWNAVDGTSRLLPEYSNENNRTIVPLYLEAGESCFMVFSEKGSGKKDHLNVERNIIHYEPVKKIQGTWNIRFTNKNLNTDFIINTQHLFDWTISNDSKIKYFSGTAIYTIDFYLDKTDLKQPLFIDFEDIQVIASVKLNGKELGTLWTKPYRINTSSVVKSGKNTLEVQVTNVWVNQLLWQKDKEEKSTWLLSDLRVDIPPVSSGIIGKVTLYKEKSNK